VGVTPARWLLDNSALSRLDRIEVEAILTPRIDDALVGVSIVTELQVGYSARSSADYRDTRRSIVERLLPVHIPSRAESRAREVQAALVERGQHRAVSIPDLLIAATAEIEGLTVLHYDADFDLIADITGQPCEWIVERGTI
jgi:predicted nucleic acid-binding protein